MVTIELKLNSDTFYAGDEIYVEISLKTEQKDLQLLDGSIQLIGRAMFVSDFYSFPRVRESFGQLAKLKEDCKVISTEKGETFTLPFYVTKPSLLTFPEDENVVNWRGRLPKNFPSSFIGLFCSFQHFLRVKIIWKSTGSGQISCSQEEVVFKVIGVTKDTVLGVLEDVQMASGKDLDEVFPDDLILNSSNTELILKDIKNYTHNFYSHEQEFDAEEVIRSIVENDSSYERSLSVELDQKSITIASIHLKRTRIHPGTQIFLTIRLLTKIDSVKLKLDCIETYPSDYLHPMIEEKVWRETVKEMKISPGCQDQLDLIVPVPPDLPATNFCAFFDFQWELSTSFRVDNKDFDLKIPIEFYSINYEFNKRRIN